MTYNFAFDSRAVEILNLEIFADVTSRLPAGTTRSHWASTQLKDPMPSAFIEGPLPQDDFILTVDAAWGRILAVGRRSVDVIAEYEGAPMGLAAAGDGSVLIADYDHGVMRLTPGGSIEEVATAHEGMPFLGPNDLTVDGQEVFFTDQGDSDIVKLTGSIYHLDSGGVSSVLVKRLPSPNGIALDSAQRQILVAVTRDNAVWRVPLLADGSPGRVGRFIALSGGVGPDGLTILPDGRLLIAHLGMGMVWVVDASGRPLAGLRSPSGPGTTNVALGHDGRIYVTESSTGTVNSIPLDRIPS